MALIFVLTLQLQPGPTIATGKVGSPECPAATTFNMRFLLHPQWLGREVLSDGGYFMMHRFMTFRSEGKFYLADAGYPTL